MNNVKNKSLRVFLALCLMVQMVMPGMVWESKAATQSDITINFSNGVSTSGKSFAAYKLFSYAELFGEMTYTAVTTEFVSFFENRYTLTLASTSPSEQISFAVAVQNKIADLTAAEVRTLADDLEQAIVDNTITPAAPTVLNNDNTTSISGTVADLGYYLILDTSIDGPFFPSMLLPVIDTTAEITLKASSPTMIKEIQHNEFSADGTVDYGWGEVGDNQIGDTVNFLVTVDLPQDITGYDNYYFLVRDDMDDTMFDYDSDSIQIYSDFDKETNMGTPFSSTYLDATTISTPTNGFAYLVKIKEMDTANVLTDYPQLFFYFEATLVETANIAPEYNNNTATLTYSNSVHTQWDGTTAPADPLDPDPDTTPEEGSAETLEDEVFDYTFAMTVTKTNDDASVKLPNATFNLFDLDADPTAVAPIAVTGSNGVYSIDTDQTNTDYDLVTYGAGGTFVIYGLDDNINYRLVETDPPTGYVPIEEHFDFIISATYSGTHDNIDPFTTFEITVLDDDGDAYTDGVTADKGMTTLLVRNDSGSVLPETGGIGTIMFYVAGIGMMAAAGFLVYKRKES